MPCSAQGCHRAPDARTRLRSRVLRRHRPGRGEHGRVEIEPISAQIAHHLYPSQQIRNHGFERNFAGNDTFTGAIGNVPFGKDGAYDPIHNADGHSLHNQFIVKSLALTAPGGYVAVVTSAYTSDARRPRPPEDHRNGGLDRRGAAADRGFRPAGQDRGRHRHPGVPAPPRRAGTIPGDDGVGREVKSIPLDHRHGADQGGAPTAPYWINRYFAQHPERVLGTLAVGSGPNGKLNLIVEPRPHTPLSEQIRRQLDPIIDRAVDRGLGFTAPRPSPSAAAPFAAAGLLTGTGIEETTVEPGTMRFDEVKGQFEQFKIGQGWTYVNCTGKDKAEQWKVLIALGETVMKLTEASRQVDSTRAERDALRGQLGTLYDRYTHRWGPLNRFTLTEPAPLTEKKIAERLDKAIIRWRIKTGKAEAREEGLSFEEAGPYTGPIPDDVLEDMQDKAATEPNPQKNQNHLKGAILRDPRIGMVLAIENFTSRFDGTDAEAGKSPIFTEDTTPFKSRAETADHVDEAMAISFDELGYLSPERMGELLDLEVGDVIDQARGRMFPSLDHPGAWEIAETFLSGHVRDKYAKHAGSPPRTPSSTARPPKPSNESSRPTSIRPPSVSAPARSGCRWSTTGNSFSRSSASTRTGSRPSSTRSAATGISRPSRTAATRTRPAATPTSTAAPSSPASRCST